ncbi:MAG: alpha/beta hydrolase [Alphaproteobacteria bacterium]|nr:alpha/beta hydrolase [Alphaproteobacteria bacterium]
MKRRTFIAAAACALATPAAAQETIMTEEDATLVVDGVRLPGRITKPTGATRASVLLLPGSLFSDADGDYPSWNVRPHVYRDFAHQLAALGIASMRQAKIGPGTGSATVDPALAAVHQHFDERVVVARAAVARLREAAPGVPLFVAGHSEGAVVASLLCAGETEGIDGMISLSGPALRLMDIMRSQSVAMTPGADMSAFDAAVADVRAGRPLSDAARANPTFAGLAALPPQALSYIREVDAVDTCAAIARVRLRTLLIQGGRDQSVTPEQVDALAAARAGLPTEIARFPELQHFYKRAAPGLDAMASFALNTDNDPEVAEAMARWMT